MFRSSTAISILVIIVLAAQGLIAADMPDLQKFTVTSTLDGSAQPSMVWLPESATQQPTPMLVFLHSWGGDHTQKYVEWIDEAKKRGWIYLHPDFRGPNTRPEACGSELARRDVLDAIQYAIEHYKVDESRLYLAGSSGGGHMTMLMAAYYPERFTAASAWVGISDLAEWYRFHSRGGTPEGYALNVRDCCGGAPVESDAIDAEYRSRSPIHHLQNVGDLPIDLAAGVKDGHSGSVPFQHSLRAFNAIAEAGGHATISDAEMEELWTNGRLSAPRPGDQVEDPSYGRAIYLRRTAGPARVTIFEGGHEHLAPAAAQWLEGHVRATRAADP